MSDRQCHCFISCIFYNHDITGNNILSVDVEDIYELELPNDKVKKIKKAPHMKVNSNSKIKVNRKSRKTSRLVPPGVPVCIYSKPTGK